MGRDKENLTALLFMPCCRFPVSTKRLAGMRWMETPLVLQELNKETGIALDKVKHGADDYAFLWPSATKRE